MNTVIIHPQKGQDRESSASLATEFARQCAIDVINAIRGRVTYQTIRGPKAIREHLVKVLGLSAGKSGKFLGFGHGEPEQLLGFNSQCALHQEDAYLLNNKICYVLACYSFDGLGKGAISAGAAAYIGFAGKFQVPFYFRGELVSCCTEGIKSYLLGNCGLREIRKKTWDKFDETRSKLEQTDFSALKTTAIWSLTAFSYNQNQMKFYVKEGIQ